MDVPPSKAPPSTSLIVYASNRCNLRCVFCLEEETRMEDMPSVAKVHDSAMKCAPENIRNVMFMGAETLLRKDAPEVLDGFQRRGYKNIGIATNGTALTDAGRFRKLLDSGLSYLEISVHSLVPEHAAEISGRSFTHARQMECLAMLETFAKERPLAVTINTVVCSINVGDVADLMATMERDYPNIVPHYQVKAAMPTPSAVKKKILASWQAVRDSKMVASIPLDVHPRVTFTDFPLCALDPHPHLSFNLASYVLADSYVYVEHVIEAGTDMLTGTRKAYGEACGRCAMRPLCSGIAPEYVAAHGEGEYQPLDGDPERAFLDVVRWRRKHSLPMNPAVADDPGAAFRRLCEIVEGRKLTPSAPSPEAQRAARVEKFVAAYLGGVAHGSFENVEIVEIDAPSDKDRFDLRLRTDHGEVRAYVERLGTGRTFMRTRFLSLAYYADHDSTMSRDDLVAALSTVGRSLARRERHLSEQTVDSIFRRAAPAVDLPAEGRP